MPDVQEVFRMATQKIGPSTGALERQHTRQQRSARNRKLSALAVAAVITAAITLFAAKTLNFGKGGSSPATVAPSGSGLTFTVVGLDGSIRSTIPGLPEGALHPDVSPDGTTVAFVIWPESQIATIRLDGTGFRVITNGPTLADRPRWSPDGSQLVFIQAEPNNVGALRRLMVMNADGSNARAIRGTDYLALVPPDWSPDGSLILYAAMHTDNVPGQRDLAIVPAIGGTSHRLATARHVDEGPGTWSPDGNMIAFVRWNGLRDEVWLMNADGSGQHRLVSLPGGDAAGPEWSPDGRTIAFIGSTNESDAVYVVDVTTGDFTEVFPGIASWSVYNSRATWLPNGDALLVMTGTP